MANDISAKAQLCKLLHGIKPARKLFQILDADNATGFEAVVEAIDDPAVQLRAITHAGRYIRGRAGFNLQTKFHKATGCALNCYQAQLTPLGELDAMELCFDIMAYNDRGGMFTVDIAILQNLYDRFLPASTMTDPVREQSLDLLRTYLDNRNRIHGDPKHENAKLNELQRLVTIATQPRRIRKRDPMLHKSTGNVVRLFKP